MIHLLAALLCTVACEPARSDTITASLLATAPVLDGRVSDSEYGASSFTIDASGARVRVWIARHDGYVYIAASLPDSTFYWGDDFVVGLSPTGNSNATVATGDRQWYLRRTLDSSVVSTVNNESNGRWSAPGHEPPTLGAKRHNADWDVASSSTTSGWSVELRIRESVARTGSAMPRIAVRTYNDQPQGWWSWPLPPANTPAQRVERTPSLWIAVRLHN